MTPRRRVAGSWELTSLPKVAVIQENNVVITAMRMIDCVADIDRQPCAT